MAHNEQTTTLSFLTDAAHLLATTAPETSAYLMSRRNDLMFEYEMPPLSDKQRHHVCSCCGHIMLLGKGSRLQVKSEIRPSRKNKSRSIGSTGAPHNPGPTKAITCGYCGRLTNIKLPAPAPISRRKVKVEKVIKTLGASGPSQARAQAQETASQKASSNASSKKRAKSRKAGLQALLDQSNASRNSRPGGLGLSLADFMAK
jgi:hypothetical protein